MKLEVGQFARTEKGEIFKINNYNEQKDNPLWMTINSKLYMKGTVIKASHNIIDLIEVGDYVNGYRVIKINLEPPLKYVKCINDNCFKENEIETILTKEQFENNCFRIRE